MNANQAQLTTGGTKLWRKMEEERVLEDRTWESMKKGYSRIMKNRQLQGENDEKEETAEEKSWMGQKLKMVKRMWTIRWIWRCGRWKRRWRRCIRLTFLQISKSECALHHFQDVTF